MGFLRKNSFFILMIFLCLPLILSNKECNKKNSFNHPPIEKGVACKDCHEDGRTKDTMPKWHDLAWKRDHGKNIKQNGFRPEGVCYLCHTESTCTACHQEVKPKDHTQFWRLKGHGLTVGMDRSRCYACHRPDFCERCHSQTRPQDHSAGFSAPSNRHCYVCHYPLSSAGGQRCGVCHTQTPAHSRTPRQPSNSLHLPGANCRSCHSPLRHPDNGTSCTICHIK